MKTIQEIKNKVEKLAQTTNYDISLIEINATQSIYNKYDLPTLFIEGEGVFRQGDATDQEIFDLVSNINDIVGDYEIDVFYNEGHEYGDEEGDLNAEELFNFLQKEYWKVYEEELMKVVKSNWIEFYKYEIEEFLKENYPTSGGQFGFDYSIYINIESGEIFEKIEASSNWMFQYANEGRKLIFHADNYDITFTDFTDLVAENDDETISENLGIELPNDWSELDYHEQVEWLRENASDEIESYDSTMREEVIETIIDLIEDHEDID